MRISTDKRRNSQKMNDNKDYLNVNEVKRNVDSNFFNNFFKRKILSPFWSLVLSAFCIFGTAGIFLLVVAEPKATLEDLYSAATIDSVTVEADEIFPLVCLTPEDAKTIWEDSKVLLVTINKKPQIYVADKTMPLPGEVWMVSAKEMEDWVNSNKEGVTDWQLRLQQLVGVPLTSEYTHVTAMWVSPDDVIRPAYSTDLTNDVMPTSLPENTSQDYRDWFEGNIMWSYFDSQYPWTRLGYTYDWAENSGEYGLTEFLVKEGAQVTIAYTDTISNYIKRLEQENN